MPLAPQIRSEAVGSVNSPGSVGADSTGQTGYNSVGSDPSGVDAAARSGGGATGTGMTPSMLAWLNEVYKNTSSGAGLSGGSADAIAMWTSSSNLAFPEDPGGDPALSYDLDSGFWPTLILGSYHANTFISGIEHRTAASGDARNIAIQNGTQACFNYYFSEISAGITHRLRIGTLNTAGTDGDVDIQVRGTVTTAAKPEGTWSSKGYRFGVVNGAQFATGATHAELYVDNTSFDLVFNYDGTEWTLNGGVGVSGTPVNNEIGVWTDSSTLEGDTNFQWDGTSMTIGGGIIMLEAADHSGTPAATYGEWWIKNDAPNTAYFTDDAGTDWLLNLFDGTRLTPPGFYNLGAATELTIVTGAITATQSYHTVDTEADAATDDLDTISGGAEGDVLVVRAIDSARTVSVTEAGNILLTATPFALDNVEDTLTLLNDGTNWMEISRSDNGA